MMSSAAAAPTSASSFGLAVAIACRAMWRGWVLALAVCTPAFAQRADADVAIPRVAVESHTEFIKKAGVDASGSRVLTVADDKTARIWDGRTGRPLAVLRVPIGAGHEGQLYAGAISPDGSKAAVGGFTTASGGTQTTVYFFECDTGRLIGRLGELPPGAVDNLAFAPDGKLLAVALSSGFGLMLFDLQKQALVRADREYADHVLGIDFNANGDLATSTVDGVVRIYRAGDAYQTITRTQLTVGREPMHVKFSPRGDELAVGFHGSPLIAVLSTADLSIRYTWSAPRERQQAGLHLVEWSSDGSSLYAAGETQGNLETPIYRIVDAGRGAATVLPGARRRLSDLRRLPGGAMLFASGEPTLGVLNAGGQRVWEVSAATADLRESRDVFRVSQAGDAIEFRGQTDGKAGTLRFSALARPESAFASKASSPFTAARSQLPGWTVEQWQDSREPRVNGRVVSLEPKETSQSYALSPDGSAILLGTSWNLRLHDRNGALKWKTPLASQASLVNVSGDGRWAIAALSDGTLRWYRMEDGGEVLGLFRHRTSGEWIAWIPPGYYQSSTGGDELMGWHLNRGVEREAVLYRAIQFERVLYRPDLVARYFRARGHLSAEQLAGSGATFRIDRLARIAPPQIVMQVSAPDAAGAAALRVHAESESLDMRDIGVFVNGIPVLRAAERELSASARRRLDRTVTVPLEAGANRIRVEIFNGTSMGLGDTVVDARSPAPAGSATNETQGTVHLLAIGVSHFADRQITDLDFAAKDARDVASLLTSTKPQGRRVAATVVADDSGTPPTRQNVIDALKKLSAAGPRDTVVLFLASHGISDTAGNYYFVPSDASYQEAMNVIRKGSAAPSLVSWRELFDALRPVPGRRVLIVDTCASANVKGTFDAFSLAKRSASSRFALLTASKGGEESQEYPRKQQGLFTYTLLEALRGEGDANHDGRVTLNEAFRFASPRVEALHDPFVGPQTPQLIAPEPLGEAVLSLH